MFPELRQILLKLHLTADPEAFLTVFSLTMARMGAAVRFIPFLGGETIPGNVQIGWTVMIAIVLYPSQSTQLPGGQVPGFLPYVALLVKELLIGTLIGLLVQIVFSAVQTAGSLMEFGAELKPQEIMAPQAPAATGPLSTFMGQAAILIYLTAGIHLIFIRALADTYSIVPLFVTPSFQPGFLTLAELAGKIAAGFVVVAFQLSAPVLLVLVMIKLGSNMIFRMSFAGMRTDPLQPVGTIAVYALLFLAAGLLSEEIVRQANGYLVQLQQFMLRLR
jgi:flagellar biosynthetic protein FliR